MDERHFHGDAYILRHDLGRSKSIHGYFDSHLNLTYQKRLNSQFKRCCLLLILGYMGAVGSNTKSCCRRGIGPHI